MAKKASPKKLLRKRKRAGVPTSAYSAASFGVALKQITADANAIVQEIVDHMTMVASLLGKSFTPGALDEWRGKLVGSVKDKLTGGGNWNNDKSKVLEVARDMTAISMLLSGNAAMISKARVHAAFRACKDHAKCPVPGGSGAWCNFDI